MHNYAPYFIVPISSKTLDVNAIYIYKIPPYIDPNQDIVTLTTNLLTAAKYAHVEENLIFFKFPNEGIFTIEFKLEDENVNSISVSYFLVLLVK